MEPFLCANWKPVRCPNEGTKACASCLLVQVSYLSSVISIQDMSKVLQYCSKECQSMHWPIHKLDCKSPSRKSTWRPAWEVEGRSPHFMENTGLSQPANVTSYGGKKYLWGNVPAFDMLQLKNNEGINTCQSLSLLLAGILATRRTKISNISSY
jgi:hypothetical protein